MRADQRARRDAFLYKIGTRPVVMGTQRDAGFGRFAAVEAALAHARSAVTTSSTSAPESTRPGAAPVAEAEELARIEPVLADLARALDVPVSVDTYKSTVAARAVELGAVMVNDVWGLQKDPGMADAVAAAEAAVVIMHNLVERVRQSTSWISGNSLHVHSRSQRRPAMRHHASSLISASHLPKAHARTPK
jgi:dihydropteroate synthase